MSRHSDDQLVAYLDGEVEPADQREIEAWLASDAVARNKLATLAQSADRLRQAYDEVLHEPLPGRLIAAARGETAAGRVLPFRPARAPGSELRSRWWVAMPIAASLLGVVIGGGGTYLGAGRFLPARPTAAISPAAQAAATNNLWLDNAAGDFRLFVSTGDKALIDVPATGDTREALQKISQSLTQQVRLPDLKPWGLTFAGARLVVSDGRPAAQLVYTTDNKAIGSLALIIGSTQQNDIAPAFDHRQGLNMLYWRHHGRAYVLVGQADAGYLWGIGNDIAWQLDAI